MGTKGSLSMEFPVFDSGLGWLSERGASSAFGTKFASTRRKKSSLDIRTRLPIPAYRPGNHA